MTAIFQATQPNYLSLIEKDNLRREKKKEWDQNNPDKLFSYNRSTTLRRCINRGAVPLKETIKKYQFTPDELKPIFDALWEEWCVIGVKSDTKGNNNSDSE